MEISLWHQCLRRLEAELPEQAFNTWIRPLQAVEDGDRLRLLAPNRYVVDWVNQNCTARISELVDELVPAPAPQVVVEIGSRRPAGPTPAQMTDGVGLPVQPRPAPPATPARPATFESQPGAPPRRPADPLPQFGGRLNPDFTFANFVEGKSNQLGRAAAVQVAENPGRAYN
ncbi:MAG: DnaA/Hda family protein, partial [Gammaproteobacteria bacterium]|nr:DnaA/Hda family protein [Gammaproteobacteria bacterium]